MRHKTTPPQAETLEGLGHSIGELRYDALIIVLVGIADELESQVRVDTRGGRPYLSGYGRDVVMSIHQAVSTLEHMLTISIPHMRDELQESPLLGHYNT